MAECCRKRNLVVQLWAGSFHHIQIHSACWEKNHPSESWAGPVMSGEEAQGSQTPAVPATRKPKALGSQQDTAVRRPTKPHRISATSHRTLLQGCSQRSNSSQQRWGPAQRKGQRAGIQAVGLPQGHAALQSCPLATLGHGKSSGVNLTLPSPIHMHPGSCKCTAIDYKPLLGQTA